MDDTVLYQEYLDLCKNVEVEWTHATQKTVRIHNRAMDSLFKLAKRIATTSNNPEQIFSQLIDSDELSVKLMASSHALKYNYCTEKAEQALEHLATLPGMIQFNAVMTLKVWRGEISGSKL